MPWRFVHARVLVSNTHWLPENLGLREAKKPRKRAGVRKTEEERGEVIKCKGESKEEE